MRWEDAPYVKLYRDNGPWMDLPLEARGLFAELLKVVDRAGMLKVGDDPARTIARAVNGDTDRVREYFDVLRKDGCVVLRNGFVTLKNYIEAQGARASDKARMSEMRKRDRDANAAEAVSSNQQVAGKIVTRNPQALRSEENRREKNRTDKKKIAADKPPLPFRAAAAVEAVATASAGRFVASVLSAKKAIDLEAVIREQPDLGRWTLVGEWIAAGGDHWKGTLDVRHLGDVRTWFAHADRWNANGRGPVNAKNGNAQRTGNTAPSANFSEAGDKTAEYT
jgi:hypothetical protein